MLFPVLRIVISPFWGHPSWGRVFVDYLVAIHPEGKNQAGFGAGGEETLLYLLDGSLDVKAGTQSYSLAKGGFVYCPPGTKLYFHNKSGQPAQAFMYKRIYLPLEGFEPYVVTGNTEELAWTNYEGMTDVLVKDFLPKELAFDCNFHILSFKPGASHGYIETHIQEHGAYCLSGQGMYNLDNDWIPVAKGRLYLYGCLLLASLLRRRARPGLRLCLLQGLQP